MLAPRQRSWRSRRARAAGSATASLGVRADSAPVVCLGGRRRRSPAATSARWPASSRRPRVRWSSVLATTGPFRAGPGRPRTRASSARATVRRTRSSSAPSTCPGRQIQPTQGGPIDRTRPGRRRACPSSPSTTSSPSPDRSGCGSSPAARTGHRPGWARPAASARTAPTTTAQRHLPIWDSCVWERAARHLPLAVRRHRPRRRPAAALRLRARSVHLGGVRLRDDQRRRPRGRPRQGDLPRLVRRTPGPTWRRSSGRTRTSSSSRARTTPGVPSARTTTCSPSRPSVPGSASAPGSPRCSTST